MSNPYSKDPAQLPGAIVRRWTVRPNSHQPNEVMHELQREASRMLSREDVFWGYNCPYHLAHLVLTPAMDRGERCQRPGCPKCSGMDVTALPMEQWCDGSGYTTLPQVKGLKYSCRATFLPWPKRDPNHRS